MLILMNIKYTGYSSELDTRRNFPLSNGSEFGKNVIIFSADMSSLVHIDNGKKDILILGKDTAIVYMILRRPQRKNIL